MFIHTHTHWLGCFFKKFKRARDAKFMWWIRYFGFPAAGAVRPAPSPGREVGSCPEEHKHTPSSGCLHAFGTSVAVSMATGVEIVGMCQRYSGTDRWTWVEEWTWHTLSWKGGPRLSIIRAWACGKKSTSSSRQMQLLFLGFVYLLLTGKWHLQLH